LLPHSRAKHIRTGLELAASSLHPGRTRKIFWDAAMTVTEETRSESRPFEADVAKLLQLMVHSVYSEKSVFLRELIANAADACERLRYEAIAAPALLADDVKPRITLSLDADKRQLTVEDNGIGMSRDEMVEALGTIARSGTKAFLDRIEAAQEPTRTRL
jgi:molecular chaperone HtpG